MGGTQTSELHIDPWQHTRTNHDGLICELSDKKQGLPRGRQLRHKSPQSNLVSALIGLLGRVTADPDFSTVLDRETGVGLERG